MAGESLMSRLFVFTWSNTKKYFYLTKKKIARRLELLQPNKKFQNVFMWANYSFFLQVHAEKRFIEMLDIGRGIVELIEQHVITKLVMGAAADRRYFEYDQSWFMIESYLIYSTWTVKANLTFIVEANLISTPSWS